MYLGQLFPLFFFSFKSALSRYVEILFLFFIAYGGVVIYQNSRKIIIALEAM